MDQATHTFLAKFPPVEVLPPEPAAVARTVIFKDDLPAVELPEPKPLAAYEKPLFLLHEGKDTPLVHWPAQSVVGLLTTAYSYHLVAQLAPGHFWDRIMAEMIKYIDEDAEACRGSLVDHEGKKELEIWVSGIHIDQIADLFKEAILVDSPRCGILHADFPSSTRLMRVSACTALMAATKNFFDFTCHLLCGLRGIEWVGTDAEWQQLLAKIDALAAFLPEAHIKTGAMRLWLRGVREFIEALRGPDAAEYASHLFSAERQYGSGPGWLYTGHILKLIFGARTPAEDNPAATKDVHVAPMTIKDEGEPDAKTQIYAGPHGVVVESGVARLVYVAAILPADPTDAVLAKIRSANTPDELDAITKEINPKDYPFTVHRAVNDRHLYFKKRRAMAEYKKIEPGTLRLLLWLLDEPEARHSTLMKYARGRDIAVNDVVVAYPPSERIAMRPNLNVTPLSAAVYATLPDITRKIVDRWYKGEHSVDRFRNKPEAHGPPGEEKPWRAGALDLAPAEELPYSPEELAPQPVPPPV